jgi:hypothetical protein
MDLTILWALLDFMNNYKRRSGRVDLEIVRRMCDAPLYAPPKRNQSGSGGCHLPILKQRICIVGPHSQAKGMCFLPNPFAPKLGQNFGEGFVDELTSPWMKSRAY